MTATPDSTPTPAPFPLRRECPFGPPAEYDRLRRDEPVSRVTMPNGKLAWIISRYESVRSTLADPRISSDITQPQFPSVREADSTATSGVRSMIEMDGPDHSRLRRMLIPDFTVKRIKTLRDKIQRHVDSHIDQLLEEGPPADFVSRFALPVPSLMICELLGVPFEDHEFFQTRTSAMLELSSTHEEVVAAFTDFYSYITKLVATKQETKGDDLISRLLAEDVMTHDELFSTLLLLLLAGHETTANMISLGIYTLLRHPEQAARLRADPSMAGPVVEEMLRLHSIGDLATFRVAAADMEIDGQLVRAGDGVIPLTAAANHDDSVFTDPRSFDPTRPVNHHVAFGFGPHQCIAQNLARATLEVVYSTVVTRMPTLELAVDDDQAAFKYDASTFGLNELPLRW